MLSDTNGCSDSRVLDSGCSCTCSCVYPLYVATLASCTGFGWRRGQITSRELVGSQGQYNHNHNHNQNNKIIIIPSHPVPLHIIIREWARSRVGLCRHYENRWSPAQVEYCSPKPTNIWYAGVFQTERIHANSFSTPLLLNGFQGLSPSIFLAPSPHYLQFYTFSFSFFFPLHSLPTPSPFSPPPAVFLSSFFFCYISLALLSFIAFFMPALIPSFLYIFLYNCISLYKT